MEGDELHLAHAIRQSEEAKKKRRITATQQSTSGTALPAGVLPTIAALSSHERRRYSLAKLINCMAEDRFHGTRAGLTLEREISASVAHDLKQEPEHGGQWVPLTMSASGLDSKTTAGGGFTIATHPEDIIDCLQASTKVLTLGAKFLSGLRFQVAVPLQDAPTVARWMGDNPGVDVVAADATFKQASLTGRSLLATTSASRQLLSLANQDVELWIRNQLGRANALALDKAAVHGRGVQNEPTGLLLQNIGVVSLGVDGAAPSSDKINELESKVGIANADDASTAFLTNSTMRSRLRKIPEMVNGTQPLWRDNSMLSHPAAVSNQVSASLVKGGSSDCSAIIFGAWSRMIIAEFYGAVEITVDPFALKRQGMVEVASWGAFDLVATAPAAFAAILDARDV